jgi:hypothetical protein
MSVGPEGAVIKVDITGATTVPDAGTETVCLDGTPIAAPGPETCGDDGGGPPPPIDVVTPPPPVPDAGSDARTADVRADVPGTGGMSGTGGTGGATGGAGGAGTGGGGASGAGAGGAATGGTGTGTGGTGTGAGGNATGTGGDTTGAGTRGSTPETPSGCGCRISAATDEGSHPGRYALFGLALAGLARRRARRRAA